VLFEVGSCSAEFGVFYVDHVGWCLCVCKVICELCVDLMLWFAPLTCARIARNTFI
jgi:hypothetical protein